MQCPADYSALGGKVGAGMVILLLNARRAQLRDHIVEVTRCFDSKHVGGDRFRHVQEAVRTCIREL